MAKFYNLTCTNLDRGDHNVIADRLSNSAMVLHWNSPQDGQFLIKCIDDVNSESLSILANAYNNIRYFVVPFDPEGDYFYCLRSDWADSTYKTMTSYAAEQKETKEKIEALAREQDIELSEGFNQKAIHLPNGVTLQISENGEIHLQEKNGRARQVRASNDKAKLAIL